jgi:Fis family transcriptional regulator, factor for inversion stimulation protein
MDLIVKINNATKANSNLNEQISASINQLLKQTNNNITEDLYKIVIESVEKPLIVNILKHTNGNQTLAAKILGISRITLRKKIKLLSL